jgi:hypothetical protein
MSTFYLLPPRPFLGECLAGLLRPLFPDVDWAGPVGVEMGEVLARNIGHCPDVYVVHREELPEGESPGRGLADGFGAEAGDEVIEIRSGNRAGELTACRWRLE